MLTLFGIAAVSIMFVTYWLEDRSKWFVAAFAIGTSLTAIYGFLVGAYPVGVVEALWTAVAVQRFIKRYRKEASYGI